MDSKFRALKNASQTCPPSTQGEIFWPLQFTFATCCWLISGKLTDVPSCKGNNQLFRFGALTPKETKKRFLFSGKNLMLHFLKLAPWHIFTISTKKRGTYRKEGVESRRVLIFHLYWSHYSWSLKVINKITKKQVSLSSQLFKKVRGGVLVWHYGLGVEHLFVGGPLLVHGCFFKETWNSLAAFIKSV